MKGATAALVPLIDYFLPLQASRELAVAAILLVALDTITGIWAALVRGRKVSSSKFARVLSKLLGYGSVVIVCSVGSKAVPGAASLQAPAVCWVLGFVAITEGISILENVGRMGVKAPPFLLEWLRKRLKEKPGHEDSSKD